MANDPREPLTPEEAAVARLYTALPRPEPPPALDAGILAQARAAFGTSTASRRTRRPWYLASGTGVAAAAVLAAGLAWQVGVGLLLDDGGARDASSAPSAPQKIAPAQARDAKREDALDVDFLRRTPAPATSAASQDAEEEAAPATAASAPQSQPPAPTSETAQAAPAPRADTTAAEFGVAEPTPAPTAALSAPPAPVSARVPAAAAPQASPAQKSAVLGRSTGTTQADASPAEPEVAGAMPAPAPKPAPLPVPAQEAVDGANASDTGDIVVSGTRLQRNDTTLPPWPEDATLAPDAWIERVRDRVRIGDREGARLSLRRFVRMHAEHRVPDDLTLLLVQ